MIALAAGPAFHPAVPATLSWDRPLAWLAAGLVALGVGYGLAMLGLSGRSPRYAATGPSLAGAAGLLAPRARRTPAPGTGRAAAAAPEPAGAPGAEFYVFLIPCLNEELVIARSLQRLLSMPSGNFAVMVIDDGSDDGTAAAVAGVADERVWLLRRTLPNARRGKGEALNDALAHLVSSGRLAGRDPDSVIIAVVDADGQLDSRALADVSAFLADPAVGAVQIGVRIDNRDRSVLARMQDMEFVIYTEVFQRGRRHLGSVGLGGNGQFVRLSALRSLGPAPWTRSLTEDLDLGVRLAAAGWRNEYCRTAAVHQQGVVKVRRLIRQRARWFQGNLQSWRLIPLVLRRMPGLGGADLLFLLSTPALVLIASLLTVSFAVLLANCAVLVASGHDPFGWWVAVTYALMLGPALAYAGVYWRRERDTGLRPAKAFWLAHLYVGYTLFWYAAGWRAAARALRGRNGWAKTDRLAEGPAPAPRPKSRRRLALTAIAAALACAAAASVLTVSVLGGDRAVSPWRTVFTGQGQVTGTTPGRVILLSPGRATAPGGTHAALVVSAHRYGDFTATATVRTVRQLRRGAAGAPHAWEVGWVLWHYTSGRRFYALALEQHGWALSKQDPAYHGGERFLASGRAPGFPLGQAHRVQITQTGATITIRADGHLLTRFTDTQHPYLTGALGLYCEDSVAQFQGVRIHQRA